MENLKILVEVSARHIHVTKEHLEILFGAGHKLTHKKDLSQPGQFACEERLQVIGPKGSFPAVSILGPERPATQVEVSMSDARILGITAPVRESGDTTGSAGIKLVGPKGEVELSEGVIIAKRHIHIKPTTADKYNLNDKQTVKVAIKNDARSIIFDDVCVRVRDDFNDAMHIDVDEANAGLVSGEVFGDVITV